MTNEKIPRKLWTLWYQGLSNAPYVVQKCFESWLKKNPTWDVVLIDSSNVNNYVDLKVPENILENLSKVHQSELVRLAILSKYGGVWADVTTFCTKPLDDWIDDYSTSGFFAFHKPGPDRLMENWFMASTKENPLILKLNDRISEYWIENDFPKLTRWQFKIINKYLVRFFCMSTKTTKYWFSPIFTKYLKIYPYFVLFYMFERVVSTDPESQSIWENTKKISAKLPLLIWKKGLLSSPTKSILKQMNSEYIPLFKVTYRYDNEKYSPDTLLYYLIEEQ